MRLCDGAPPLAESAVCKRVTSLDRFNLTRRRGRFCKHERDAAELMLALDWTIQEPHSPTRPRRLLNPALDCAVCRTQANRGGEISIFFYFFEISKFQALFSFPSK
jgi:hypothetical protein